MGTADSATFAQLQQAATNRMNAALANTSNDPMAIRNRNLALNDKAAADNAALPSTGYVPTWQDMAQYHDAIFGPGAHPQTDPWLASFMAKLGGKTYGAGGLNSYINQYDYNPTSFAGFTQDNPNWSYAYGGGWNDLRGAAQGTGNLVDRTGQHVAQAANYNQVFGGAPGAAGAGAAAAGGAPGAPGGTPGGAPMATGNNTLASIYNSVSGAPTTAANPFNFGVNDQYKFAQQPGGYQDPSYQFRVDEGMRNLLANKAAFGGLGSGNTLRDVINYGQGAASQEYGAAYNRFNQDRQFNYGVSSQDQARAMAQAEADRQQANWEKQFGYNASVNDQNTNWAHQMALAQLGLAGAGGAAGANQTLAQIIAGLTTAGGQAGATGTIGQNNAITGAISQLISQWLGQQQVGAANDQTAAINNFLRRGG